MQKTTQLNEKEIQIVRYALVLLKSETIKEVAQTLVNGEKEDADNFLEILEETLKLIKKLGPEE